MPETQVPGDVQNRAVGDDDDAGFVARCRRGEALPPVAESGAPVSAPGKKDVSPTRVEALSDAPQRAIKQEAGRAPDAPLPEQKRKASLADAGAAPGEMGRLTYAPAPSPMMGAAAMKRSFLELTIQTGDVPAAVHEIEKHLGQINARLITRRHFEGLESFDVEIPAQKVAALLDRLDALGKVNVEKRPASVPDGHVTVSIKIAPAP